MIKRDINFTAISGILFVAILGPLAYLNRPLEIIGSTGDSATVNTALFLYIFATVLSLGFLVFFLHGFQKISEKYQDKLLKNTTYLFLASSVVYFSYFALNMAFPMLGSFMSTPMAIFFGVMIMPFSTAVLKLKSKIGPLALFAGILGIFVGALFLSVFLQVFGFLFLILFYALLVAIQVLGAEKSKNKVLNSYIGGF